MTSPFGDLISFASKNRGDGVLIEPRFYFDTIDFTTAPGADADTPPYSLIAQNSDSAAYTNGEQFPVRLTHMVVAPLHTPVGRSGSLIYQRPSGVQYPWLRVERYSEYYMNEQFIRASAWHNVPSAQPYNLAAGTVTHKFFQPLVLSARDSLRIDFEAVVPFPAPLAIPPPPGTNLRLAVVTQPESPAIVAQVTGVGMRSGRPYFYAAPARPTNPGSNGPLVYTCDPGDLMNTGNEPVALVELTVNTNLVWTTGGEAAVESLVSDTRFFRVQIQQQGNGTQSKFCKGPTFPTPMNRMPLPLLGTHLGDAVVHRFPGDGITLEPGEVVRLTGQNQSYAAPTELSTTFVPTLFGVAFAGYLMVT